MKRLITIVCMCVSVHTLLACSDTICYSKLEEQSCTDVYLGDTVKFENRRDSVTHVAIDFNNITKEGWCWHYLIEILSIVATSVVPIASFIWTYKNQKREDEKAQLLYKVQQKEKYHKECAKQQSEILQKLCKIDGMVQNDKEIQNSEIIEMTNDILISVPYLTNKMYDSVSEIIGIIEEKKNKSISKDDKSRVSSLMANYIDEYKKFVQGELLD